MKSNTPSLQAALPGAFAALGSALLFYSGIFAFLFAVPVQVVFTRRGPRYGVWTAAGTAAFVVVVHLLQVLRLDQVQADILRLLFFDSLMPVGLLVGLTVLNLNHRHPWWARLLIAALPALLGAVPSLRILSQASDGTGPLSDQVDAMMQMLGASGNTDVLLEAVRQVALNTIGVGITAAVAANWWLGRSIVLRRYGLAQSLRGARVADEMIWMVIAGLAIVIATWLADAARWAPVGWNALLVAAFLYGVHGVGLIQHLLRRRGMTDRGERWVLTVVLMLLFVPGINLLAMLGVPLLGMSEVWIDYKRGEDYERHSEH